MTLSRRFAVIIGIAASALSAQDQPAAPPTCTVTVRVVDVDGAPIEGAGVAVGAQQHLTTDDALLRPAARSDRDGRLAFAVPAPAAGALAFVLAARHHLGLQITVHTLPATGADLGVLPLYPGATLRGRVRDRDGRPVADARVEASELTAFATAGGDITVRLFAAATTDGSGIYSLAGAPTGPCHLSVVKPGYYAARLFPVWADTPLSPVLDRSGFVRGRVLGEVQGARVYLQEDDPAATWSPEPVAADGSFALPVTGRSRIRAQLYAGALLDERLLHGPQDGVELRAATLPVRVTATAGGVPVPAFTVQPAWGARLSSQMDWHVHFPLRLRGSPGTDGRAEVPMPATAERGLLQLQAEGFAIARAEVTSPGGEVRVELQRGAVVAGKVVDAEGAPLAGARAFAQGLPDPGRSITGNYAMPPDAVVTGADGSFRIDGLPGGRFAIVVDHPDFEVPEPRPCKLEAGQGVELEPLALQRLGSLRGRLRGKVPAGAMVGIASPQQEWRPGGGLRYRPYRPRRPRAPAADGGFELADLPHAAHELVLLLPPSHPEAQAIELPLGSHAPAAAVHAIDLRLAAPAAVRGRIEGVPAGAARSWRVVALQQLRGTPFPRPMAFADVGADGHYALRVAPGDYRLVILDLRTGLLLHRSDGPVTLAAGDETEVLLAPQLQPVTVELGAAAAEDLAGYLRVSDPDRQHKLEYAGLPSRHHEGLPLPTGERRLRFFLPPGDYSVEVVAHTAVAEGDGTCPSRLGQAMFTVADAPLAVPLPLGPGDGR